MPIVYEVNNVEEAVDLASKFKDEGKYNWFRGQIKDWIPHSSLYRIGLLKTQELQLKINRDYELFINWIREKRELNYLLEENNQHQLEAILQHYGFPTNYIDFTTEPSVAGFFACDTLTPSIEVNSCIYCLDVDDLISLWEFLKDFERKGAQIEKVIIDVSNLWRLQAQHGVFLKVNYNWEIDYPLDKIIFPHTGYPSYPTKDIVYPLNKSPLELLLDEFFDKKKTKDFFELLTHNNSIQILTLNTLPNGIYDKAFNNPVELRELPSWNEEYLIDWHKYEIENYHQTSGFFQKLSLAGKSSEVEIKNLITYGITQMLRSQCSLRKKTVQWLIEDTPLEFDKNEVCRLLGLVWNGMRLLPFSNEEIGVACGNLIYLHMKKVKDLNHDDQKNVFSELFGQGLLVGFSIKEGNGSSGYVSNKNIFNAMEIKLQSLVVENKKDVVDNPYEFFRIIYNPRLMFDFNKFKTFFAEQIIPTQISQNRSYVIYNPAKIVLFGNQ